MKKDDSKKTPKKEVMDLSDILVDKSNKTMILDLNELEFDDEKTEDISNKLEMNAKTAHHFIIDEKKEMDLEDLLESDNNEMDLEDLLEEEKTIDHLKNLKESNEMKTVVISIEDIIETAPPETKSLIEDDNILNDTFDGLKTTSNTFIKNIDFKLSNDLMSSNNNKEEYTKDEEEEDIESIRFGDITIDSSSEILLDYLIYGKLDEFGRELRLLQDNFDNNTVDLIKYMFEFYVKKDD